MDEERYQPCLFDRLIDYHPDQRSESLSQRTHSLQDYRRSVLRDLSWLLNSCCHPENALIYGYPEAASSVLNYGMNDLCGVSESDQDASDLEQHMRHVIRTFEPRIIPESLSVRAVKAPISTDFSNRTLISFEIEGELWAIPFPEQFHARTDVDLETGRFTGLI